jgi:hypothetical protein
VGYQYVGWQVDACDLFKRWYYQWRSLTGVLSHFAWGQMGRFDPAYIEGLLTEELGPFLLDKPRELDTSLGRIAESVIRADRFFQSSPIKWEFHFADPKSGKPFGFKFNDKKRLTECVTYPEFAMELYVEQLSNISFCVGLPVDRMSNPCLLPLSGGPPRKQGP